jgi:hypothetical protein
MSLFNSNDIECKGNQLTVEAASLRLELKVKMDLMSKKDKLADMMPAMDTPTGLITTADYFVTKGAWSTHDLLYYLLQHTGPASVYLSTYAISNDAATLLIDLLNTGQIKELHGVLDKRIETRNAKVRQFVGMNFSSIGDKEACHAKVTVIMNGEHAITLMGSSNYSNNKRIEAGIIIYSQRMAEFNRDWIINVINDKRPFDGVE